MASKTIAIRAISIGKTKLGESDLIIRLLCEDGSRLDAVAKGARKPHNSNSSKVEISNELDLLLVTGKGLPIIKECKLAEKGPCVGGSILISSTACTIAEFLCKTSHLDLEVPRYYDLAKTAFSTLNNINENECINVLSSFILKACSVLGMRPVLHQCAACSCDINAEQCFDYISFSYDEGGVVCSSCEYEYKITRINRSVISIASWFIQNPFSSLQQLDISSCVSMEVLDFAENWTLEILGFKIKSIGVLKSIAFC